MNGKRTRAPCRAGYANTNSYSPSLSGGGTQANEKKKQSKGEVSPIRYANNLVLPLAREKKNPQPNDALIILDNLLPAERAQNPERDDAPGSYRIVR